MNLRNNNIVKLALDFVPLLGFFLAFKIKLDWWIFTSQKPLIFATFVLVVTTVISFIIARLIKIQLDKFNVYSNIAVVVFGLLTLGFQDDRFIKIKLTIINGFFAIALFVCSFILKKPILKSVLGQKIIFKNEKAWFTLATRFMFMFLIIAIANEIIWRNFPTSVWVNYKVFIVVPASFLFLAAQMPFIFKNISK